MPDEKKEPQGILEQLNSVDWDTIDVGPEGVEELYKVDWDTVNVGEPHVESITTIPLEQQLGGQFTKGVTDVVTGLIGQTAIDMIDEGTTDPGRIIMKLISVPGLAIESNLKLLKTFFPDNEYVKRALWMQDKFESLGGIFTTEEQEAQDKQVKDYLKTEVLNISKDIDQWVDKAIPTDDQAGFWAADLPRGFGSMTGFMLGSLAARGKGLSPGLVSSILGAQSEGFGMFKEAYEITHDLQVAEDAARIGKIVGTTEGIPIASMFKKFENLTSPTANNLLKKTLQKYFGSVVGRRVGEVAIGSVVQGLEEAIQETGQQFAENLTAQQMYDFERDLGEGLATGGGVGLITGTVMAALGFGGTLVKHKMSPQEIETAQKMYKDMKSKLTSTVDKESKLSKITNSLGAMFNIGKEGAITFEGLSEEDDVAGRGNVQAHFKQLIDKTVTELNQHPESNIIDGIFRLGQNTLATFIDGANTNKKGNEYFSEAIDQGMLRNLTPKQLSETTDDMYFKAVAKGMEKGMGAEFETLVKPFNEQVQKEIVRDFVAATVLDFGAAGYYLLGEKYKNLGNAVAKLAEVSQNLKEQGKYVGIIDTKGQTFVSSIDPLARTIQRNSIKKIKEDIKGTLKKEDRTVNSILESEEGPASEAFVKLLENEPTASDRFAEQTAASHGYKFDGSMKTRQGRYFFFTDPRTGSTHGLFEEQLSEDHLRDMMEGKYKEWKDIQSNKDQTKAIGTDEPMRILPNIFTPANGETIFKKEDGKWYRVYESGTSAELIIPEEELDKEIEISEEEVVQSFDRMNKALAGLDLFLASQRGEATSLDEVKNLQDDTIKFRPTGWEEIPGAESEVSTIGEQLAEFKGENIKDLWHFLKKNKLVLDWSVDFFEKNLLPIVGETSVKIMEFNGINKTNSGLFRFQPDFSTRTVEINSNSLLTNKYRTAAILIHESIHAWTAEFLYFGRTSGEVTYKDVFQNKGRTKGSDERALAFFRQISSLRGTLKEVLTGPTDRSISRTAIDINIIKNKINNDIGLKIIMNKMMNDNDEFIAYALMGNAKIIDILNDILHTETEGVPKQGLFKRFVIALGQLMQAAFGKSPRTDSLLTGLYDIMSVYELDLTDFGKGIRAGHQGYLMIENTEGCIITM